MISTYKNSIREKKNLIHILVRIKCVGVSTTKQVVTCSWPLFWKLEAVSEKLWKKVSLRQSQVSRIQYFLSIYMCYYSIVGWCLLGTDCPTESTNTIHEAQVLLLIFFIPSTLQWSHVGPCPWPFPSFG